MSNKFVLEINLGNEAMQTPETVAIALEEVVRVLRSGRFDGNDARPIRDINGNRIGEWTWVER